MMHPDQIALKALHADIARDFQPKSKDYGKRSSGPKGTTISAIVAFAAISFAVFQFGLLG